MEIIVKNYQHYNRTLGKYISTKRQYFDELKRRGLVTYEEGCKLAQEKQKESKWIPSKDCVDVMKTLYDTPDRKKTIRLMDYPKIVEKMKEKGVSFDMDKLPKYYQGGFNNDEQ